jgi:hypothetical protein
LIPFCASFDVNIIFLFSGTFRYATATWKSQSISNRALKCCHQVLIGLATTVFSEMYVA